MVWRICQHVQCINVNTMLMNCVTGGLWERYMFKDISGRSVLEKATQPFRRITVINSPQHNMLFINTTALFNPTAASTLYSRLSLMPFLLRAAGFFLWGPLCAHHADISGICSDLGWQRGKCPPFGRGSSGDGAKKRPTSAQMGKSSLAVLLWV